MSRELIRIDLAGVKAGVNNEFSEKLWNMHTEENADFNEIVPNEVTYRKEDENVHPFMVGFHETYDDFERKTNIFNEANDISCQFGPTSMFGPPRESYVPDQNYSINMQLIRENEDLLPRYEEEEKEKKWITFEDEKEDKAAKEAKQIVRYYSLGSRDSWPMWVIKGLAIGIVSIGTIGCVKYYGYFPRVAEKRSLTKENKCLQYTNETDCNQQEDCYYNSDKIGGVGEFFKSKKNKKVIGCQSTDDDNLSKACDSQTDQKNCEGKKCKWEEGECYLQICDIDKDTYYGYNRYNRQPNDRCVCHGKGADGKNLFCTGVDVRCKEGKDQPNVYQCANDEQPAACVDDNGKKKYKVNCLCNGVYCTKNQKRPDTKKWHFGTCITNKKGKKECINMDFKQGFTNKRDK